MIWLVQLAFDAHDPDAITQFWGRALEYQNPHVGASAEEIAAFRRENPQFDGRGRIDDNALRRMPVYIQRVPEPKPGRNRVRPEVAANVDELAALGAEVSGDGFVDIEGNEFTVVADRGPVRLRSIVIDAREPLRLLEFWSAAIGYVADTTTLRCEPPALDIAWTGEYFRVGDARTLHTCGMGAAPGPARFDLVPGLQFVASAEPKSSKNRLHFDLNSTDALADRERLVQLGATVLQWDTDHVLADPEGNEFCLGGRLAGR